MQLRGILLRFLFSFPLVGLFPERTDDSADILIDYQLSAMVVVDLNENALMRPIQFILSRLGSSLV